MGELDLGAVRFVFDELLEHRADTVTTAASNLVPLDRDEEWHDLLDPSRSSTPSSAGVDGDAKRLATSSPAAVHIRRVPG